jgi:hypothetical protein
MVTDADVIAMNVEVLRGAAGLICDRGDLERRAFLCGFAAGWWQAMEAAAERGCAA